MPFEFDQGIFIEGSPIDVGALMLPERLASDWDSDGDGDEDLIIASGPNNRFQWLEQVGGQLSPMARLPGGEPNLGFRARRDA